jgi:ABC-type multidrug transport system fused ATPase/permease subunit
MTTRLHRRFGSWIIHHAFEFKWFYLGAFICLYVLQVFQSQLPERIRGLTELMSQGRLGEASVWIFLGLAGGILIFRTFSRLLFFYPARVQQKLLRMELLEKLEAVPPARYQDKGQGQIFQILFDDINNLRAFIGFGLLQVGNLIIAAWVLIPKLNQTDGYLWPAFTPLFSSVALFTVMTFINQKIFKKMADKKGEVQQYIIEAYEAKQTIKNFHREESFIQGFYKASNEELSLFFKSSIGFAITGPYIKLGLGASLLWAAVLIRAHGGNTSDLVFFSGFLYLFLEPVMFMSWVAVVVSQGFAAWKRVKELHTLLDTTSAKEDLLRTTEFKVSEKELSMELDFWQERINLILPRNKWSTVIGETGSGKSYLLQNFATALILQGKKVSMVQQEPYLFNDTIEGNIFLGKEVSGEYLERAKSLIKMFQLDGLADTPEEVLKLEVGENGKRLSGGQMKRVALIRSLMSDAEFIVWDDPFSSVDIILERKIIQALKLSPMNAQRTFAISSHRLTTVRLSDNVIFIEKNLGIHAQGSTSDTLKDAKVADFFKEQLVDLSLA